MLAETWVDISEDSTRGDNQDGKTFKIRVWKSFCNWMGKTYHSYEQIYSKQTTTNKNTTKFNVIYTNTVCNTQSGVIEVDITTNARGICQARHNKPF